MINYKAWLWTPFDYELTWFARKMSNGRTKFFISHVNFWAEIRKDPSIIFSIEPQGPPHLIGVLKSLLVNYAAFVETFCTIGSFFWFWLNLSLPIITCYPTSWQRQNCKWTVLSSVYGFVNVAFNRMLSSIMVYGLTCDTLKRTQFFIFHDNFWVGIPKDPSTIFSIEPH